MGNLLRKVEQCRSFVLVQEDSPMQRNHLTYRCSLCRVQGENDVIPGDKIDTLPESSKVNKIKPRPVIVGRGKGF